MKISYWPPALIYYTDDLPEDVGGQAIRCVIYIRPKYEHDAGIHAHELTHVKQWWLTLFLHSILYLKVRRYRLWSEVVAYHAQMRHGMTLDVAAYKLVSPRYDLQLTFNQAREELLNYE